MAPGKAALIENSNAVVKHKLEGFFVTTEGALLINSFFLATKVVFGWESIKKCIKHEFHDPLGEIINEYFQRWLDFSKRAMRTRSPWTTRFLRWFNEPSVISSLMDSINKVFFFLKWLSIIRPVDHILTVCRNRKLLRPFTLPLNTGVESSINLGVSFSSWGKMTPNMTSEIQLIYKLFNTIKYTTYIWSIR